MAKQTLENNSTFGVQRQKINENFDDLYENKQDDLVSGTNIKRINGSSILGSGDLTVSGTEGPVGPKGDPGVAFLVGEDIPAERFDTYELGVSGTTDGEYFGVVSDNEKSISIYKNVSGFGVYERTMGWTEIQDYDLKNKSITYGISGNISSRSIIDFDSISVFSSQQKIRNLSLNAFPDERYLISNVLSFNGSNGATITDGAPDRDGGTTGVQINLPADPRVNEGAPVAFLNMAGYYFPSGQYSILYDVRLADGSPNANVFFVDRWPNFPPSKNATLTTSWQTLKSTFVLTDDESESYAYRAALVETQPTPSSALTIYACNIRIVVGDQVLPMPVVQADINATQRWTKMFKRTLGAVVDWTQAVGTSGLVVNFPNPITFKAISFVAAIKMTGFSGTNYNMFFGFEGGYIGVRNDKTIGAAGDFIPTLYGGTDFPLNVWLVIGIVCDDRGTSVYLNGIKSSFTTASINQKELSSFRLFNYGGNFNFVGQSSGISIWDKAIGDEGIKESSNALISRLKVKNETFNDIGTILLALGDSITNQGYYIDDIKQDITPKPYVINYGVNGRVLGDPSDNPGTNSLFADIYLYVDVIKSNVSNGRMTIVTIHIGANGVPTSNPTQCQEFYDNLCLFIKTLRDLGARVIASTVLDNGNIPDKTALNTVNNLILSDPTKYDAVADYYGDSRLTPATSTYFQDLQHPNQAGGEVMAELLLPKIQQFYV